MIPTEELQKIINRELDRRAAMLKSKQPAGLYKPVDYSLAVGGKRVRPLLLLMAYNLFSDEIENALPAALAVEMFHNFTLLHDDIMDKAEVRRNQPTVHKKFSENSAILSGDAMAFLSYQLLFENHSENNFKVARLFTETALEVCEGQQYDMEFENRSDVTVDEYLEMIRLKTAVLLACSLQAGAMLANAADETSKLLYDFGINTGMAFQLQDDLLDTFGDQKKFGKKIGTDIIANKKTFLLITALEKASDNIKTELEKWLNATEFCEKEKIESVTEIYNKLGIKELTEDLIESYFSGAEKILKNIPVNKENKKYLSELSKSMLGRKF